MRTAFTILLLLHGLIHLFGFLKAFNLTEMKELTLPISKPWGVLWLNTTILFVVVAILYFLKIDSWWILAFATILLSQIVVIVFWKDAKFGTIANVLTLLVALVGCGLYLFQLKVDNEISVVKAATSYNDLKTISANQIRHLPDPVQRWMKHSGMVGKDEIRLVRFEQSGKMKLKPEQEDWIDATAIQYNSIETPQFVWAVKLKMMGLLDVVGMDRFNKGKGSMLIKLLTWFPVVNSFGNNKINQGSLQRYLSEIIWYPSAALHPSISWESIDEYSAQATMTLNETTGSGTFYFDSQGNAIRFEALRYKGDAPDSEPLPWITEVLEIKELDGIKIPTKCNVTWRLPKGDWTWLQLEIKDVDYNPNK